MWLKHSTVITYDTAYDLFPSLVSKIKDTNVIFFLNGLDDLGYVLNNKKDTIYVNKNDNWYPTYNIKAANIIASAHHPDLYNKNGNKLQNIIEQIKSTINSISNSGNIISKKGSEDLLVAFDILSDSLPFNSRKWIIRQGVVAEIVNELDNIKKSDTIAITIPNIGIIKMDDFPQIYYNVFVNDDNYLIIEENSIEICGEKYSIEDGVESIVNYDTAQRQFNEDHPSIS